MQQTFKSFIILDTHLTDQYPMHYHVCNTSEFAACYHRKSLGVIIYLITCNNISTGLTGVLVNNTIHYNTLQCNITIQYNAMHCNTFQYNIMQRNAIQCYAMHCNTIQYNTTPYNTTQYNTMQYNAMQCNAMQYNTIQYRVSLDCSQDLTC